jgi:uncharacterized protein YdaU (DUF1376 family)
MSTAWFPFYPGDYLRDTPHLSVVEHGAYLLLLIFYFATERPLPKQKDALYRIVRAYDRVERTAVDSVVSQFFVLGDDGHHHERADAELAKRAEFHNKLSAAGRKRWQQPGIEPGSSRTGRQECSQAIASPQSQSQSQSEKETSKTTPAPNPGAAVVELPDWLPQKEWNDYLKMRKRIRREATPEAITLAIRDLEKLKAAGNDPKLVLEQSILNSWQGLFELRTSFPDRAATDRAQRNADASVGRFDPTAKPRVETPEEKSEMDRTRIEVERWDELEKGTLLVNAATVAWATEKRDRLKRIPKLPAQDPRPRWLKNFLDKAATPEQVSA